MPNQPKNEAAVSLGKLGGLSTSEAKQAAARLNGKKGGRPKNPLLISLVENSLKEK